MTAAIVQWHRQAGLWFAARWYATRAGGQTIGAAEAMARIADDDVVVLDVRDRAEYEVSHVPGARNLPLKQIDQDGWSPDWPTDRPVLTYCTIGYRSGVAAKQLAERGLDAHNVLGGIVALAQQGQPFVDADGPTLRVHTWKRSFAWMLPKPYETVAYEENGR
ncbi:MAG: rhodanese-like domain-containing protein [Phycisphaerae bacterium]